MTGQHTQGRLEVADFSGSSDLERAGGEAVAIGLFAEDARRLAACWNACEGLTTEKLEGLRVPVLQHLTGADENAARLVTERDQLSAEVGRLTDVVISAGIERDQLRAELARAQIERDAARALLLEVEDKSVYELAEQDSPEGIRSTGDLEELQARIRDLLDTSKPAMMPAGGLVTVAEAAQRLVEQADALKVVLTITQQPRLPLAMGNYDTVVEVRPARGAY